MPNQTADRSIKAVIFDLYNTLVYARQQTHPYRKLFQAAWFSPSEIAILRNGVMTFNATATETLSSMRVFCPHNYIKLGQHDLDQFMADLATEIASVRAYADTFSVLEQLKSHGYALGLISNLAEPFKQPVFDLGLSPYFDKMIFSCDVGVRKPGLDIYRQMIKALGLPPDQMLMTGDQLGKDVEPPRALGMKAVLLDRSGRAQDSIRALDELFDIL